MNHKKPSGGSGPRHFCVFYSRPPFLFEVHAPSPHLLRKKVEEIDTVIGLCPLSRGIERNPTMIIRIKKAENGWTVEIINSPEMPTKTVLVAKNRKELMHLLELEIPQD